MGILTPAVVDADSRYRRYRRVQLPQARLIAALRWVDLPIEQVRAVLADPEGAEAAAILASHRVRLERQRGRAQARMDDVDRMLENGVTMPTAFTGCHPVQIKIAVDDRDAAIAFYQAAFGMKYEVTRRTEESEHSCFLFGAHGESGFFLIHLVHDPLAADRPGPATFGLSVDDLDARHEAALAAGGVEAVPPRAVEGMPRCSAVRDPSGNWVWLYQG